MNGEEVLSGIYMPAANVHQQVCMEPTGWQVIRFWKQWYLLTGVLWTA